MSEKRFESYYDGHIGDWKVQDNKTLQIYPCVSESVAKELSIKLNILHKVNMELREHIDALTESYDILQSEYNRVNEENVDLKKDIIFILSQEDVDKREELLKKGFQGVKLTEGEEKELRRLCDYREE